jgi:hypothetical protein
VDDNLLENRLKARIDARKKYSPPVFVQLDEFHVKLPSRSGEHSLSTAILLRVADNKTESRIKDLLPLIRDRLLTVLSSRPMEQLSTVEGKDLVARECALVINAIIEPEITAIYVLQQDAPWVDMRKTNKNGLTEVSRGRTSGGIQASEIEWNEAKKAAAQFWKVTEMDLPVQGVIYTKFIMQ